MIIHVILTKLGDSALFNKPKLFALAIEPIKLRRKHGEKPCTIKSHLTSDWLRKWCRNLSAHQKEKKQSVHKIYWPAITQHL